jgi:hypothetical protein
MGFWNKFGKIALSAAPYVAAPFTGGLSLMATGAANKAVSKWSEHDAKEAIAKGLAPSKFDNILGKVNAGAAMGSMFIPGGQLGALGKAADTAGKVASTTGKMSNFLQGLGGGGSGLAGMLGNTASAYGMSALDKIGQNPSKAPQEQVVQRAMAPSSEMFIPENVFQQNQPSDLANSIFAGKQQARRRYA